MTKLLIAGGIILLIGVAVLIVGLALNGWKFGVEWKTENYVCENAVDGLDAKIDAGRAKVEFFDGDKAEVTYPVSDRYGYTVVEEGGNLKIRSQKHGFFWWNFFNEIPELVIKLPRSRACDLKFGMSAGTAEISGGTFKSCDIKLSAGSLNVGEIECGALNVKLSAGEVNLNGATAASVDVKLSAGKANLNKVISDRIKVDLSAGDASLNVIGAESEYSVTVDKSAGSCNLNSRTGTDAGKLIDIDLSAGSVNVSFTAAG